MMGSGFSSERIDNMLKRTYAFWRGESTEPMVSLYSVPDYRQVADDRVMVEKACACIQADGAGGEADILPIFNPDFGTVSTAAIWGGEIIPPEGVRNIHIHPVVRELNDLRRLKPRPFEETDFARALRLYREICDRLAPDPVFLRLPDFQGPMNTLSLMMDQTELICGLYDEPELLKEALSHITDTLIAYVDRFLKEAGKTKVMGMVWPYIALPGDLGVSLTQDYMPLLNPELYREFEIPLLKRIADHFGGVFIHCCGQYTQHFEALHEGNFKIWGLESHYPCTKVTDLYRTFGEEIAYMVYVMSDGAAEFPSIADYAAHLSETECAKARFWFATCTPWENGERLKRVVKEKFGKR